MVSVRVGLLQRQKALRWPYRQVLAALLACLVDEGPGTRIASPGTNEELLLEARDLRHLLHVSGTW
jgi:hypothetical protein